MTTCIKMFSSLVLLLVACAYVGTAKKATSRDYSMIVNPDEDADKTPSAEYGDKFEGDIDADVQQMKENRNNLNFAINKGKLWPKGVVPYEFGLGDVFKPSFEAAIADFEKETCIRWVKRNNEDDFVKVQGSEPGCFAALGRQSGVQKLNIPNMGCSGKGTVIHEMMHTLGFYHEHQRSDRDQHIKVHINNVQDRFKYNFDKQDMWMSSNPDSTYDYNSVMHYDAYSFSVDPNKVVIETIGNPAMQNQIGQRAGMSKQDAKEINMVYKDECAKSG